MRIIKEHVENRIIIRTDTYAHVLSHFLMLFEEAKKDFPDVKPDKIEVIHYGGRHYARTYGIEFNVEEGTPISSDYEERATVEYYM